MLNKQSIINLRVERQHLTNKADETEYLALYGDLQPGQNVYWNGFGDPPSLTFRAGFNDIEFNRNRQQKRDLIKGRFVGGNIGWIIKEDLEIFSCLFRRPIKNLSDRHLALLKFIEQEGPSNIQQMKETSGMFVKEITPALHRLQKAFMIYEDQYDGEWDRGWYKFSEMFPDVNLEKYTKLEALRILLRRFAYRQVLFSVDMAKSFYKLPLKEITAAVETLASENVMSENDGEYILNSDLEILKNYTGATAKFVYAMHRNDFLVKSNEHWLKIRFKHPKHDTLQYLMVDGEFRGVCVGHFRNGPYDIEDVIVNLSQDEIAMRRNEILEAIYAVNYGKGNRIKRFCGEMLQSKI